MRAVLLALTLLVAPMAAAHGPVGSSVADGAVLQQAPRDIVLTVPAAVPDRSLDITLLHDTPARHPHPPPVVRGRTMMVVGTVALLAALGAGAGVIRAVRARSPRGNAGGRRARHTPHR